MIHGELPRVYNIQSTCLHKIATSSADALTQKGQYTRSPARPEKPETWSLVICDGYIVVNVAQRADAVLSG